MSRSALKMEFFDATEEVETMSEPEKATGREVTFKRHAHLFTLISTVWTGFSVLAILFVNDRDGKGLLMALGIWTVHALCIALSIYFWKTEKDSVLWIEPE